jgi:hypothetical protein
MAHRTPVRPENEIPGRAGVGQPSARRLPRAVGEVGVSPVGPSDEPTPEPTSGFSSRTLDITLINASTGEILRELVLDPHRDHPPTGAPEGPTQK